MDPTTEEGREALRHAHAQMLAEERAAKARGCTPSSAPTVRWMTAATDNMLAALSHIEKLECQRDTLRAELERAREALAAARDFVSNFVMSAADKTIAIIDAALSPFVAAPASCEPTERELDALKTVLAAYGVYVASTSLRNILIATAAARRGT